MLASPGAYPSPVASMPPPVAPRAQAQGVEADVIEISDSEDSHVQTSSRTIGVVKRHLDAILRVRKRLLQFVAH